MIKMKIVISIIGLLALLTIFSVEVSAYSCPKGFIPTFNQVGKQSGYRKA
jgi:hypothetical protein